jgi:hypothetical protein
MFYFLLFWWFVLLYKNPTIVFQIWINLNNRSIKNVWKVDYAFLVFHEGEILYFVNKSLLLLLNLSKNKIESLVINIK